MARIDRMRDARRVIRRCLQAAFCVHPWRSPMPRSLRSSASTCSAATTGARTSGSSGACTLPSIRWLPANRAIADIDHAPRNASGKVEFSSDLLFFRPKDARRARGTVFLEVVNRGRDQSLAILSGAQQRNLSPESWNLGDGFLLEQGFAVAFLGWQFDVRPVQGLTFTAPIAPVEGLRARCAHRARASGRRRGAAHVLRRRDRANDARRSRFARAWTRRRSRFRATAGSSRRWLLDARHVRRRHRHLRGRLPRERFTGRRSRPRRHPRLRVVSEVRPAMAPRCARRRPRCGG